MMRIQRHPGGLPAREGGARRPRPAVLTAILLLGITPDYVWTLGQPSRVLDYTLICIGFWSEHLMSASPASL